MVAVVTVAVLVVVLVAAVVRDNLNSRFSLWAHASHAKPNRLENVPIGIGIARILQTQSCVYVCITYVMVCVYSVFLYAQSKEIRRACACLTARVRLIEDIKISENANTCFV